MDAAEDGQDAHPQAACTDFANCTNQAAAASERRFFGYFFAAQKSNIPRYGSVSSNHSGFSQRVDMQSIRLVVKLACYLCK